MRASETIEAELQRGVRPEERPERDPEHAPRRSSEHCGRRAIAGQCTERECDRRRRRSDERARDALNLAKRFAILSVEEV